MANKVSYLIQLQDRFSRQGEKIRNTAQKMVSGFDKLDRKIKKTGIKMARLGKQAKESGRSMSDFGKSLSTRVTLPLAAFGTVALTQSAKLETLAVSFETMTGSAEKGQKLLEQLTEFTATTPFQLEGVAKATKTLLAFKVPLEAMPDTLRMLGDIAAGTDAPLADIAQIFGKARAKGKLMTEELLQLAERGIPVIDVLADRFGVTKDVIFEAASKSQISFEIMEDALKGMTATGGIFFDQTKRQSATLGGVFSTLKDNIALTSAVFGDIIVDVFGLKDGIAGLNDFFGSLRERIKAFAKENPAITKMAAIFAAFVAVLGPLVFIVGQLAISIGAIVFVAGALGVSIAGIAAPVMAVVGAIGLLIAAGLMVLNNWDEIKKGAKLIWRQISGFFTEIARLAMTVGDAIFDSIVGGINSAIDRSSSLVGSLGAIVFVAGALGVSIAGIAAPVMAVVGAIGLLIAAGLMVLNNWDEIKKGAKLIWRQISGFFTEIARLAIATGSVIFDSVMAPINTAIRQVSQLGGALGSFFDFGDTELKAVQSVTQRSQTDINVNLRAPDGAIESVQSKTTGKRSGLNTGITMAGAM